MTKKRIAILGSTGSIGTQTLDVVSQHPDQFEVKMLSANNNVELLAAQAVKFGVRDAVVCNTDKYAALKEALAGTGVNVHSGMDAVCDLICAEDIDIVVGAMVGFSGLRSTLKALSVGKTLALANKETLVAGGSIVEQILLQEGSGRIIPVDSEHSAIFQCLQGNRGEKVAKIHLTASGGPFREWDRERIAQATRHDALKHPNWSMGAKVTIDSASMMNKGLEVIEAKWLFAVDVDDINVIVHPQSIVHSMVEYEDGAVLAQLGCPDMREPIQYALGYPHRLTLNNKKLDFATLGHLDFFKPDLDKFPCLALAIAAIKKGGSAPVAMNAANEVAVAAFLQDRISFYQIAETIEKTISGVDFVAHPGLDDVFGIHDAALKYASNLLK